MLTLTAPNDAPATIPSASTRRPLSTPAEPGANALLGRVWKVAATTPDTPAFRMPGTRATTYGQLWNLSTGISRRLARDGRGRTPALVIGGKSPLTVAAFLACLRSGRAYVPVDPSMPAARVESMRAQIAAAYGAPAPVLDCAGRAAEGGIALAMPRDEGALAGAPWLLPGEPARWVAGEEAQYVIFTSGSTGTPKGIVITEDDVRNFMGWLESFPVIREGGRTFIDQAPYSFDLSEYELVGALATGGCLYALPADATRDYRALVAALADSDADVWVSTPPFADLCLADRAFAQELMPRLSLFLFCGDTLTHRTAAQLRQRFPQARVANTYGPTESTVAVTYCEVTDEMIAAEEPLPVGYPRPGTELRIVRADGPDGALGTECPAGASGEIVIIGDTVAKGYLGDQARTDAAFFEAALSDGRRVRAFRTGDIGHLDADGMLRYEGRGGSLVKLNGFRIELGDVEMHLCSLDGVKMAAVVCQQRRGRVSALKAYVIPDHAVTDAASAARAIRRRLAEAIPAYMVPRTIKVLASMPLTANGKIDRKLLAAC